MANSAGPSRSRKILAAVLVLGGVAAIQGWIVYRERAPEPKVIFPKELRDIPS